MAQQPSFSSNNPFRRKAAAPSAPTAPPLAVPSFDELDAPSLTPEDAAALPPSADRFRHQLQALTNPSQPPPTTSFQKPKVVKKVRVQSPPPSSPESPEISDRFPPVPLDDGDSSSTDDTDEQLDPFTYASSAGSADVSDRDEPQVAPSHRPPPNPFQKTLKDLEIGAADSEQNSSAGPGTKGVLDVGAFGRLLLTGQTGIADSQGPASYTHHLESPPIPSGNGTSTTNAAYASRPPISDTLQAVQETPKISRETSEHEADDDRRGLLSSPPVSQPYPSVPKKKPPPPSSRHGKRITPRPGGEAEDAASGFQPPLSSPTHRVTAIPPLSPSRQRPPTPSDVNKPLPPAPHRSPAEEDTESVFDREAAGKVPEPELQPGLNIIMPPRPPTPPNASHAISSPPATASQGTKKPAPPPRRQPHGRSESNVASAGPPITQHDETDPSQRRSSLDSIRSRSSSLRVSIHAPAPPPPRRPGHPSRAASSHSLPPSVTSPGDATTPSAEPSPSPSSLSGPIVASPPPIDVADTPSSASTPGTSTPTQTAAAPSSSSSTTTTTPTTTVHAATTAARHIPPPPPPARNASVRAKKRPTSTLPSSSSNGVLSRRSSGKEPPPPPKHRDRGGSRGSGDVVSAQTPHPPLAATTTGAVGDSDREKGLDGVKLTGSEQAGASAAGDILADLSALQREVDALRGVYEAGEGERRE